MTGFLLSCSTPLRTAAWPCWMMDSLISTPRGSYRTGPSYVCINTYEIILRTSVKSKTNFRTPLMSLSVLQSGVLSPRPVSEGEEEAQRAVYLYGIQEEPSLRVLSRGRARGPGGSLRGWMSHQVCFLFPSLSNHLDKHLVVLYIQYVVCGLSPLIFHTAASLSRLSFLRNIIQSCYLYQINSCWEDMKEARGKP